MSSSYPALQKKFMSGSTDGTDVAEDILVKAGARVEIGLIYAPKKWNVEQVTYGEILDAQDFLCDEFDHLVIPYGETYQPYEPTQEDLEIAEAHDPKYPF